MDVLQISCLERHPFLEISVSSSIFDFCDFDSLTLYTVFLICHLTNSISHPLPHFNLSSSFTLITIRGCARAACLSITGDPVKPARPQAHIRKSLTSPSKHSLSRQHLCQEEIMSNANSLDLFRNEADHSPPTNFAAYVSRDADIHAFDLLAFAEYFCRC